MAWTHTYDLLIKILLIAVIIFLCATGTDMLEAQGFIVPGNALGISVMCFAVVLYVGIYQFVLRTLSSYLYARWTLKMPVSFAEARTLNKAFTALAPMGRWMPMRDLLLYPPQDRYRQALAWLHRHEALTAELDQRIRNSTDKPLVSKTFFEIAAVLVVIAALVVGFMNYPPANYLSAAQAAVLGEGQYYPFLNVIMLVIPPGAILFHIEKKMNWK